MMQPLYNNDHTLNVPEVYRRLDYWIQELEKNRRNRGLTAIRILADLLRKDYNEHASETVQADS